MKKVYYILFLLLFCFSYQHTFAQEIKKAVSEMTKEELSQLSYQDLMTLPLEDLMTVANKFGLSADEILEYFLNRDVTSASKRAEKSLNSPLSTTVISKEEIENSGATSIPEALRMAPGIIVREKTNGNYDVQIRGNDNLPPNGMMVYSENTISLVMIDGRPVYNYSFGGTFWEALPIELSDVERIEVIRGPSSALYGPNAVSGAINIITRTVDSNKTHVNGQVQAGNSNSKLANAAVSFGVKNNLKVRLSGNYSHFDRFEDGFYDFDYAKTYTGEEMKTLHSPSGTLVVDDFTKSFPDPKLGLDKYAGNAFISYNAGKKVSADLATGAQSSDVITSALGNNGIPIVGRTSSTKYIDFRLNAYGFHAQANYMTGDQDLQKSYTGFHIEPKVSNYSLEYEKTFGSLVIRPGISYQRMVANDEKWVDITTHGGYLNGTQTGTSLAYFLRADYKMFDKLRLIAAIRADKYNHPDITSWTYQFISSYDINENNVIRAGYSRANRGSFTADTYANYDWKVIPGYYTMHYQGNQNMKLPVMDNIELGFRTRPSKNVMVEIEAFHSQMKDFTFFTPDAMTMYFDLSPVLVGEAPPAAPYKIESHGQYQNLSLKSVQDGVSLNLSVVLNTKLNFKIFGTWQHSKLSNFYKRTIWDDFQYLQDACSAQYMADIIKLMGGDNSPLANPQKEYTATFQGYRDSSNVSMTNKWTPSFYGGATVNYSPTKRININSTLYYFSEQTLMFNMNDQLGASREEYLTSPQNYNPSMFKSAYTVDPKVIVNLKISYKFWKDNSVFFNARNLFNSSKKEFAFLDEAKGLYMVGANFNF